MPVGIIPFLPNNRRASGGPCRPGDLKGGGRRGSLLAERSEVAGARAGSIRGVGGGSGYGPAPAACTPADGGAEPSGSVANCVPLVTVCGGPLGPENGPERRPAVRTSVDGPYSTCAQMPDYVAPSYSRDVWGRWQLAMDGIMRYWASVVSLEGFHQCYVQERVALLFLDADSKGPS